MTRPVRLDIPPVPALTVVPPLRSMSDRLAHPRLLRGLQEVAVREDICRNPIPFRYLDEATGELMPWTKDCGATQERKCPACARHARRLRIEQAQAGWHLADEPLPAPELSDDQVELLKLRGLYEFLREEAVTNGQWQHVIDLDEEIDKCERQLRYSGLRGNFPPRRGPDPAMAAAWQAEDAGALGKAAAAALSGSEHGEHADATIPHAGGDPDGDSGASGDGPGETGSEGDPTVQGGRSGRRSRSTRRREDAPDLPRRPVADRTIGRTYTSTEGKVFRPSTFFTATLPSYGRVREDGTPVDPDTYDYAAMARDAVHFPALIDRYFQNLRRAEGWNVQYFGCVEPQRRLAPHAHFAIRGAIPRHTIRQVYAGTYKQIWWPPTDHVRYEVDGVRPVWNHEQGAYCDPDTGRPLTTWDEALDAIPDDADPYHVVRFGAQYNIQGVLAGTPQGEKLLGYLTKYMTKSVADCHKVTTDAQARHAERVRQELAVTPCSSKCANWLRYGIQPQGAKDGLRAGYCRGKVHQPATLGLGGRRILVSRRWSGKTLADHRYDRGAWVRDLQAVTRRADDPVDAEHAEVIQQARNHLAPNPLAFDRVRPGDPGVPDRARLLLLHIERKRRERAELAAARTAYAAQQNRDCPG